MGVITQMARIGGLAAFLLLLSLQVDCGSSAHCTGGAACSPANPCHAGVLTCQGDTPSCSDQGSPLSDGTACGVGATCVSGLCTDAGTNDGGCPTAVLDCGPNRSKTCVADDPNNCGDCNVVCPTGRCRAGACFGCRSDTPQDCPNEQICVDDYCGKPCSFDLSTGSEPTCDAGFCRPYASTDPPTTNVGICTPGGSASDPGMGAACVGPCAGNMDCVAANPPDGGLFCSTICDPTRAGTCPSGWGCDATLNSDYLYIGYGICRPITPDQAAEGQSCSDSIACQPGTYCLPSMPGASGNLTCESWCNPYVAGTCGLNTCSLDSTPKDLYSRIGSCLENVPNARALGQSCSRTSLCQNSLYCLTNADGGYSCQQDCQPWATESNCPAGSSCIIISQLNGDYDGFGLCFTPVANGVAEFGKCDFTAQNCAAGLSCETFGSGANCVLNCDPFNAATCPSNQWCIPQPDTGGHFSGSGFCNGELGTVRDGQACATLADCASGVCYFPSYTAPTGTCIHACALGTPFGCPGGACADAGFGNGLGYCVLADGGSWN